MWIHSKWPISKNPFAVMKLCIKISLKSMLSLAHSADQLLLCRGNQNEHFHTTCRHGQVHRRPPTTLPVQQQQQPSFSIFLNYCYSGAGSVGRRSGLHRKLLAALRDQSLRLLYNWNPSFRVISRLVLLRDVHKWLRHSGYASDIKTAFFCIILYFILKPSRNF